MNQFAWLIADDIAIAALPKVASTSILEMYGEGVMPAGYRVTTEHREVLPTHRRVMWIREPYDRLISAYSFLRTMLEHQGDVEMAPKSALVDWPSFIDHILEHNDPHWQPQVEQMTYKRWFVPTEVHRFENLHHTWPLKGPLPWLRGTQHEPVDATYRHRDLDDRYVEDRALWLSAAR